MLQILLHEYCLFSIIKLFLSIILIEFMRFQLNRNIQKYRIILLTFTWPILATIILLTRAAANSWTLTVYSFYIHLIPSIKIIYQRSYKVEDLSLSLAMIASIVL